MKISYSWLKDYLEFDLSPQAVADALTSIGLEVDSVTESEQVPGGLKGVVVAEVKECIPHPDSDHLHITKVDDGGEELLTVICGAPNVAAGEKVLFARIGAVLPGDFKIKKSKIRGVESYGMICAEDELGIGSDHAGIMVLPSDAVTGTTAKDYLHLSSDAVIEIDLTANRVDAASHIGVARDLYAYLQLNKIPCELHIPDVSSFMEGEEPCGPDGALPIQVDDVAGAPRYSGITLRGVRISSSPEWMQKKLLSIGLRPINNVVDISNFVLMECGQPLHTFDADKVSGGKIIVRRASEGEKLVTLDGIGRSLKSSDMVIADKNGAMCLAGVFGGSDSGVTDSTEDVFLESAYFDPVSIRKTSKSHGLQTDASYRYERGADPECVPYALMRASLLIQEFAGGKIVGKIQENYPVRIEKKVIDLDYDRMESLIGKKIGHDTIENILGYLNYDFIEKRKNADGIPSGAIVAAPTYMIDVYRECDVIEEVLRIYGYNNIELPSRLVMSVNPTSSPEPEAVRNGISNFLSANGFAETMNNSLTKSEYYVPLKTFPEESCVRIVNPLSSDLNVMRQTLILNGLEVISYNIRRQTTSMKFYEYGSVYRKDPGKDGTTLDSYEEHSDYTIFITGTEDKTWCSEPGKGGFYQLKGYVELLLSRFGINLYNMEYEAAPEDIFSEGLIYKLPGQGRKLLSIGTVSPSLAVRFDVKQPVFAAEINWDVLFSLVKKDNISFSEMPKFPEVKRDLALLFDESVPYADIRRSAFKSVKKILKSVTLFDVYRGGNIPSGKKQYALSFVLQNDERTLTDDEVDKVMNRLISSLGNEFGAVLR
ncbi:MAG: phenylalanine--tRNA ligase subunit beta [Bacteroidales bacterium]|jgi:phenylalanyl-tRNA synthetase beta chain|nr:phenylalanine--tRNA ligase subunit beta [Bacteroidales bacterium]